MNRRNFRRKAARAGIRKPFSFTKAQVQQNLMTCEKEYQGAKEEAPKLRLNHLRERLRKAEESGIESLLNQSNCSSRERRVLNNGDVSEPASSQGT